MPTPTRRSLATTAVLALAASLVAASPPSSAASPTPAAYGDVRNAGAPDAVPGAYLVKLRADAVGRAQTGATARSLAREFHGTLTYTYPSIGGFAVDLSEREARRLAAHPQVAYVEQDQVFHAVDTQSSPPWGLDRIDQASRPVDSRFTYPASAGQGVNVYVIDSGIRTSHTQFGGRAKNGYDFIDNDAVANDCNGHGTHVAGTVAGSTYGVAKKATVYGVKVLRCDGYTQGNSWLAGMDWVARNAVVPAVANMSIGGGGTSTAIDDAARAMINAGVTLSQAAGNEGQDACGQSPGRLPAAITVAASDSSDARSIWNSQSSNHGSCVDLAAPGSNILSASHSSDSGTATMGGTSMAAPHVAGAAALYLGVAGNSGKTPAQVHAALVDNASTGKLTGFSSSTPNRLLNIGFLNGTTPDPDPDPDPEPEPTCGTTAYTGTLASGAQATHPSGGSFTTTVSGTFRACLTGPAGTDFDVYLQRSSFGYWQTVAEGSTPSNTEAFTWSGTPGTYRWVVHAYSGSGAYTLGTSRP